MDLRTKLDGAFPGRVRDLLAGTMFALPAAEYGFGLYIVKGATPPLDAMLHMVRDLFSQLVPNTVAGSLVGPI